MENKRLTILIPENLHHAFKVQATTEGRAMTDVILDCIQSYVKPRQEWPAGTKDSRAPYDANAKPPEK